MTFWVRTIRNWQVFEIKDIDNKKVSLHIFDKRKRKSFSEKLCWIRNKIFIPKFWLPLLKSFYQISNNPSSSYVDWNKKIYWIWCLRNSTTVTIITGIHPLEFNSNWECWPELWGKECPHLLCVSFVIVFRINFEKSLNLEFPC